MSIQRPSTSTRVRIGLRVRTGDLPIHLHMDWPSEGVFDGSSLRYPWECDTLSQLGLSAAKLIGVINTDDL